MIIKSVLAAGVIYTTIFLKVWGSADDTNRLVSSLRQSGYLPKQGSDDPKDVSIEFQEEMEKFRDAFYNIAEEVHKVPEKILKLYYLTENYFRNRSSRGSTEVEPEEDCDE